MSFIAWLDERCILCGQRKRDCSLYPPHLAIRLAQMTRYARVVSPAGVA